MVGMYTLQRGQNSLQKWDLLCWHNKKQNMRTVPGKAHVYCCGGFLFPA